MTITETRKICPFTRGNTVSSYCIGSSCMAWNSEGQCSIGARREECPHISEEYYKCEKCEKRVAGFCKLIDLNGYSQMARQEQMMGMGVIEFKGDW